MTTLTLSVPDISCDHCKASIEEAVGSLETVDSVEVSVDQKTVNVSFRGAVDLPAVTAALEDQGYDVER